jgi:hypothetical protein
VNATSRIRGLARFWRIGAAIAAVFAVALAFTVIHGRQSGQTQDGLSRAPSDFPGSVVVSTPAAGFAAAAPTSAAGSRPASGAPLPAATAAPAPASAASRSSSGASSSSDASILNAPLPGPVIDQKIVRTATVQITAQDVTGVQRSIWNLADELKGNVLTSNTSGTGDNIRSEVAFRVPTERYQDAIDRIHGYAVKVEKEQSSAQDVTEDYVDLQARQRNLEATIVQYQALLTKATTVDETLKVQAQLNNVQSDLERIKGKLNYYDQRSAYSTISVTILPVPPPAKPDPVKPVSNWSFNRSVQQAWNRSVNGLQNVADAIITVIIGGWWIEFPLVLAIIFLARRERRRRPVPAPVALPITNPEPRE